MLFMSCVCHAFASVHCCLATCWERTDRLALVIPAFFFGKRGILISYKVGPSVTFLVNVSPPKPLEVATSNFVAE